METRSSVVDFLNTHIRGRYRSLHLAFALYAALLLLLDYGMGASFT